MKSGDGRSTTQLGSIDELFGNLLELKKLSYNIKVIKRITTKIEEGIELNERMT